MSTFLPKFSLRFIIELLPFRLSSKTLSKTCMASFTWSSWRSNVFELTKTWFLKDETIGQKYIRRITYTAFFKLTIRVTFERVELVSPAPV